VLMLWWQLGWGCHMPCRGCARQGCLVLLCLLLLIVLRQLLVLLQRLLLLRLLQLLFRGGSVYRIGSLLQQGSAVHLLTIKERVQPFGL
jgi:hypothetical protein